MLTISDIPGHAKFLRPDESGVVVGIACGYFYIEYNSFTAAIFVHFIANIAENISTGFLNSLSNIFYKKT